MIADDWKKIVCVCSGTARARAAPTARWCASRSRCRATTTTAAERGLPRPGAAASIGAARPLQLARLGGRPRVARGTRRPAGALRPASARSRRTCSCATAGWRSYRARFGRTSARNLRESARTDFQGADEVRTRSRSERLAGIGARARRARSRTTAICSAARASTRARHPRARRSRGVPSLDKETRTRCAARSSLRDGLLEPHPDPAATSSGTTGTALPLWSTRARRSAGSTPSIWRQRGWFGVPLGDRFAASAASSSCPSSSRSRPSGAATSRAAACSSRSTT